MSDDVKRIQQALAAPFHPDEIEWKAQTVSGNRCLAVAYIDARCVMERLDAVLGVGGWSDAFDVLEGGTRCRLSVKIGGEWVTKEDVGGESNQPDEDDRRKAAVSDALKRAAVKVGVGRYLYSLPKQWVDYDPQKKQIVGTPRLPDWALPAGRPEAGLKEKAPQKAQQRPAAEKKSLPELVEWWDAKAKAAGVPEGKLGDAVVAEFAQRLGLNFREWPESASEEVTGFAAARYAELVGPLPVTEQQAREVEQLLLSRQGATWAKLKSHLKTKATRLTALTRAEYAAAVKALEALPEKPKAAKGDKGAA